MVTAALARLKLTSAIRSTEGIGPGFWISEDDYRDIQVVISAYQAEQKFTAIITGIVQHHQAHPDHGINCACMDAYILQLRNLTEIPHAQRRLNYVLQKVASR